MFMASFPIRMHRMLVLRIKCLSCPVSSTANTLLGICFILTMAFGWKRHRRNARMQLIPDKIPRKSSFLAIRGRLRRLFALDQVRKFWQLRNYKWKLAQWNEWSSWSECSESCSAGVKSRKRECAKGAVVGKAGCLGTSTENSICTVGDCRKFKLSS